MAEKTISSIKEFERSYLPRLYEEEEMKEIMEHPELYGTGIIGKILGN